MSCPHSTSVLSTPDTCSQCAMASARVVTYDPSTRRMLVDGAEIVRPVEGEDRSPPNKGGKGRGRRQKTCGLCGLSGHTRATCQRQRSESNGGTEAMDAADRQAMGEEDR